MEIDDPKIVALKDKVTAAEQEFDLAVRFHEVWKPAAYDDALHRRLGKSYATQAFLITKAALRREMLLALMRLWDTNKRSVCLGLIPAVLRDSEVIDALALDRTNRLGFSDVFDAMRDDLAKKADKAIRLLNKYLEGGSHHAVMKSLRAFRHERLAHRQVEAATPSAANATDDEIEQLYQDTAELIETLLALVKAIAYDTEGNANVYRFYADQFWNRVREAGGPRLAPSAQH